MRRATLVNAADIWQEMIDAELYPPKQAPFRQGIETLLAREDLSGTQVLDDACGVGQVGPLLRKRGAKAYGVDIDARSVARAKDRLTGAVADALRLPYRDCAFDHVLSLMHLHTMPDAYVTGSLSEMSRVLRPGGSVLFAILDPDARKWDLSTLHYGASASERNACQPWLFHLLDGRVARADYFHRTLAWYQARFQGAGFTFATGSLVREALPDAARFGGRYASEEFLFGRAVLYAKR